MEDQESKMGVLWVKDSEKEKFDITISNAYAFYVKQYKDRPTFMFCSLKDKTDEFEFEKVRVKPCKLFQSGMIWITGINLQKSAGQKYDGGQF